jgi:hypothetical protein
VAEHHRQVFADALFADLFTSGRDGHRSRPM